jgi:hypothetical protein
VRPFCARTGLDYEEVSPLASYRAVLGELHRVGLVADDLAWGPLWAAVDEAHDDADTDADADA